MIILYNPPSSANKKPVLPMSLLALGAVLQGRFEYEIVDGNLWDDPERELELLIDEHRVAILAITVMPGPQLTHSVPLCSRLKTRFKDLSIMCRWEEELRRLWLIRLLGDKSTLDYGFPTIHRRSRKSRDNATILELEYFLTLKVIDHLHLSIFSGRRSFFVCAATYFLP